MQRGEEHEATVPRRLDGNVQIPATYHDWSRLSADRLLALLDTTQDGLDPDEATAHLLRDGTNTLPRAPRPPWFLKVAANFLHLLALLLWVAVALAWVAGMSELATAISVAILFNGVFS